MISQAEGDVQQQQIVEEVSETPQIDGGQI
jgi:hypothetical protein